MPSLRCSAPQRLPLTLRRHGHRLCRGYRGGGPTRTCGSRSRRATSWPRRLDRAAVLGRRRTDLASRDGSVTGFPALCYATVTTPIRVAPFTSEIGKAPRAVWEGA